MKLRLSFAISEYDHVRDFTNGDVLAEGIEIVPMSFPVEEIFSRGMRYGEFDVSEMSMGNYLARVARDVDAFTAIPVFPSRMFRHSCIFVRRDRGITAPADLAGKRVGVPSWRQTATIWARGILAHEYGLDLASIAWLQAGIDEPARPETAAERALTALPPGVTLQPQPGRSLNELLLAGEIDALIAARPPQAFLDRRPEIVRLFADYRAVEEAYFRATGIFPMMHVIVVRRDVATAHPWAARNLYHALVEARRRAIERALDHNAARLPVPWSNRHAEEMAQLFGPDFVPYGLAANRRALEAFAAFAFEQGVAARPVSPEELFARELHDT
jgi:4,5-dihydroxyphthalate decarboxylase